MNELPAYKVAQNVGSGPTTKTAHFLLKKLYRIQKVQNYCKNSSCTSFRGGTTANIIDDFGNLYLALFWTDLTQIFKDYYLGFRQFGAFVEKIFMQLCSQIFTLTISHVLLWSRVKGKRVSLKETEPDSLPPGTKGNGAKRTQVES